MNITIKKADKLKTKPNPNELGFGKYLSDHMFMMDYSVDKGWYDPRIVPYQSLYLDPAALVLHYNQEVFEGLKAYKLEKGGVGLFRPGKNIERFNRSAERMAMPPVDPNVFMEGLRQLIMIDQDWIPNLPGTSMYIRPTMIATEAALGVRASKEYLFYIIVGPVGPYYPEGFAPTRIFVSDQYARAAEGGSGQAKTSGNYGPTIFVSQEVIKKGYSQVLWLDAKEKKYIEEVGTSNIFLLIDNELITPPLGGTILNGITRDSVKQLAKKWGYKVSERKISIDEDTEACKSNRLTEAFASGTAAVISPGGEFYYQSNNYIVNGGQTGQLSQRLFDTMMGIQYGQIEDENNWSLRID